MIKGRVTFAAVKKLSLGDLPTKMMIKEMSAFKSTHTSVSEALSRSAEQLPVCVGSQVP